MNPELNFAIAIDTTLSPMFFGGDREVTMAFTHQDRDTKIVKRSPPFPEKECQAWLPAQTILRMDFNRPRTPPSIDMLRLRTSFIFRKVSYQAVFL